MKYLRYLWRRKTTAFGYIQVSMGVVASSDGIFPPHWLKYIILVNGLTTAVIGHWNNSQLKKAGNPP